MDILFDDSPHANLAPAAYSLLIDDTQIWDLVTGYYDVDMLRIIRRIRHDTARVCIFVYQTGDVPFRTAELIEEELYNLTGGKSDGYTPIKVFPTGTKLDPSKFDFTYSHSLSYITGGRPISILRFIEAVQFFATGRALLTPHNWNQATR